MMLNNTYVIDTNAIVDLFRRYPPDIRVFKPIWDKIEKMIVNSIIISHYEVYREIEVGDDMAVEWCKNHKKMFIDPDNHQIKIFKSVRGAYEKDQWNKKITQPGPWADPWIVTLAIQLRERSKILGVQGNVKIITQENKNKRNNIPKIAESFGIESLNLIEFFREIGL
ncbi:MAG TPA: DUF4411 family protein [Thermococcaceae archaeon]|nr:MAG: Uncharacterized protein XD61_1259 [Thermococcus sp. 40_45]HII66811.1 DUF4411 family protein [Thermococcaceae archaeon]